MVVDYQKAKVYSIRSYKTDNIYIGSTTQPLNKRFYQHKMDYKYNNCGKKSWCSSFELMKYDDVYIELIIEAPCKNKEDLRRIEGGHIRDTKNCCNKRIAGRTKEKYYKDNIDNYKNYYYDNIDKISLQRKEHRRLNKEVLNEKHKIWREENKEILKLRREQNKDKINERKSKSVNCTNCNKQMRHDSLSRHKKICKS